MLSGRALAVVVLGRALLRVTLRRLFREKTGIALFHDNYDADRLPPLSVEERALLPELSRCIACGRCDVGEGERMMASAGAYPGLMALVLASSRSMPDHDAAARALAHVPEEVLADKELVCPTHVPFRELARFVQSSARQMLAGATPPNPSMPPPALPPAPATPLKLPATSRLGVSAVGMLAGLVVGCASSAAAAPTALPTPSAPITSSATTASKRQAIRPPQAGQASYYADSLAGNKTASGEIYDPALLTAAHRTLPLGSLVRVIRRDGRAVEVKINDRGPFGSKRRIIDLSRSAAEQLGLIRAGVADVTVEVLELPPPKKKKKHRR